MNKLVDNLLNISRIEELARRDQWINNLHPLVKLIVTLVYIIALTSVDKYELNRTILFGIYPILLVILSDIPIRELIPKLLIPIIFGASLGLLNPLLDDNLVRLTESLIISAGWLSFGSLLIKSLWLILAVLFLVATTPIEALAYSLAMLKVPQIICIQFLLTFRYLTILIDEFDRTITAYSLRSMGNRRVSRPAWGSLLGNLFFRASQRSVKLYDAMKLRGFEGRIYIKEKKLRFIDGMYLTTWVSIIGILVGLGSNI